MNKSISDKDFQIILVSRDNSTTIVNWTVLSTDLPSNFLYIFLNLKQSVYGSSYYDNVIYFILDFLTKFRWS